MNHDSRVTQRRGYVSDCYFDHGAASTTKPSFCQKDHDQASAATRAGHYTQALVLAFTVQVLHAGPGRHAPFCQTEHTFLPDTTYLQCRYVDVIALQYTRCTYTSYICMTHHGAVYAGRDVPTKCYRERALAATSHLWAVQHVVSSRQALPRLEAQRCSLHSWRSLS